MLSRLCVFLQVVDRQQSVTNTCASRGGVVGWGEVAGGGVVCGEGREWVWVYPVSIRECCVDGCARCSVHIRLYCVSVHFRCIEWGDLFYYLPRLYTLTYSKFRVRRQIAFASEAQSRENAKSFASAQCPCSFAASSIGEDVSLSPGEGWQAYWLLSSHWLAGLPCGYQACLNLQRGERCQRPEAMVAKI